MSVVLSLRAGPLVWVGYRGQRSWREEWGEEKWTCTRAIDFWIPRVRWRTQRSDWLKLTDYINQCKLTAFHITRTVSRLCSRSVPQALTKVENSCELFTGREGCFRSLCRPVSVRDFFQLFSTAIEQKKIWGKYPNGVFLVIFPLIGLIEDQVKEWQPLGLTCASLQDVNDLFSDDPVPQRLFVSAAREGTRQWLHEDRQRQILRFPNKLDW